MSGWSASAFPSRGRVTVIAGWLAPLLPALLPRPGGPGGSSTRTRSSASFAGFSTRAAGGLAETSLPGWSRILSARSRSYEDRILLPLPPAGSASRRPRMRKTQFTASKRERREGFPSATASIASRRSSETVMSRSGASSIGSPTRFRRADPGRRRRPGPLRCPASTRNHAECRAGPGPGRGTYDNAHEHRP